MKRLLILGATGSLGRHVLQQALAAGHQVSVVVRNPSRLPADTRSCVTVHQLDLATVNVDALADIIRGHEALINCAGLVTEGQAFVDLVGRLVSSVESLAPAERLVCWFLAGAGILDIGSSGRRGVELPKVRDTYWPHLKNFERLSASSLDWRLLCPGPMVEQPPLGVATLRMSLDRLPTPIPALAHGLPGPLMLLWFASRVPQMIIPYADAAALMLDHLTPQDALSRHRVGLALPVGMRGKKDTWAARPRPTN